MCKLACDREVKDMKVLLAASPIAGHFNPVLVAARLLRNAGHETAVYSGSLFREKVEAANIAFFPLPADVDFDLRDFSAAFPEWKRYTPGPQQILFTLRTVFANSIPSQFEGLKSALEQFNADLVMYESAFLGVLPLLLESDTRRPACACLSISTLPLLREDGAPRGPGLPPATNEAQREQHRSAAQQRATVLDNPTREHTDRILDKLGVPRLPGPIFESMGMLADLIVQPCVPSFEFPFIEPPRSKVGFIGCLFPEGSGDVPREIKQAKETGKRIVLASQGTVVNNDLGKLVAPVIEAFGKDDDKLILVTTGGKPVSDIPCPISANTVAVPFLNFSEVLAHVDVLVALGGYGTVTQALSRGVPMVLAGHGQDKPEIAARVAWTGCGIRLDTDTPSADQLRQAVDDVLSNPDYRTCAKQLAAEFATLDAARELPHRLEALVADRRAA
jgi:UDP:flavonoid glycosyltransferase YjiC (YdhE family)